MDVITLSRLQFAITTIYHFLFVPVSLGLSIFIAIMQTMYLKTDNIVYSKILWKTLYHFICHGCGNWYRTGISFWYELV